MTEKRASPVDAIVIGLVLLGFLALLAFLTRSSYQEKTRHEKIEACKKTADVGACLRTVK